MPEISSNEADVLEILRKRGRRWPAGMPTHMIRSYALDGYYIRYDQVDRALRGLLDKGYVEKPKRGYWIARERP